MVPGFFMAMKSQVAPRKITNGPRDSLVADEDIKKPNRQIINVVLIIIVITIVIIIIVITIVIIIIAMTIVITIIVITIVIINTIIICIINFIFIIINILIGKINVCRTCKNALTFCQFRTVLHSKADRVFNEF